MSPATTDVRPLPFDFGLPMGAQYYRAPTPTSDNWERDLDQLKAHGMNIIKIWVQWRWSHPAKDEFYFDDIDELMNLAAERDLRVVINIIFDVMPAWVLKAYPDSRMLRQNGQPLGLAATLCRQIGGAPGPCLNHPEAREEREQFLTATVERYKDHPALWFWDLWNEPELSGSFVRSGGPQEMICWCPSCKAAFMDWLQRRYVSLDELNAKWARNYRSWDEVEIPSKADVYADWIAWRMFFRDTLTNEFIWRADLTRRIDETHPVMCHTVTPRCFNIAVCGSDDFDLAAHCDLFGNTSGARNPLATDLTRSAAQGKPLIASEIHALPGSTLYRPTPLETFELEREILLPLFRGTKGFMFWQYRAELLGREAPAWGMTKPDGSPEPWLEDHKKLSAWLQKDADFLVGAEPEPARVAMLIVPENEIFFYCSDLHLDRYWDCIFGMHDLLRDAGHAVDFIHPMTLAEGCAKNYETIVAPAPYAYPKAVADALIGYVSGGGRLVAEGFMCAHDPEDGMASTVNPGMGFHEVFGCREVSVTPSARVGLNVSYTGKGITEAGQPVFTATEPVGSLPSGTAIEARFAEQHLECTTGHAKAAFSDGSAAVVENRFGQGSACFIGAWVSQAYTQTRARALRDLVDGLLNVTPPFATSEQVGVDRLHKDGRHWLLLTNNSAEDVAAAVELKESAARCVLLPDREDVHMDGTTIKLDVPAGGHCVLELTT